MKRIRSLVERALTGQSMTPNAGGGRTRMAAPRPEKMATLATASPTSDVPNPLVLGSITIDGLYDHLIQMLISGKLAELEPGKLTLSSTSGDPEDETNVTFEAGEGRIFFFLDATEPSSAERSLTVKLGSGLPDDGTLILLRDAGAGVAQVQASGDAARMQIGGADDASTFFGATDNAGNFMKMDVGILEGYRTSDPPAPSAGGALYYIENAGKWEARIRFPTGAVQVIATEP
jgi:hypothetical protein